MKGVIIPVILASLAMMPGLTVYSDNRAQLSGSCRRISRIQPEPVGASATEREPTFNETRDFILGHTSAVWSDSPGSRHLYTLTFAGRRLKFMHTFTSEFVPGYTEKFAVDLADLDPTKAGMKVEDGTYISLATTNGENKVAVEINAVASVDEANNRKFTQSTLAVPGSNSGEDQDKMDARLRKAWMHLIKLAGGKPSQEEPF